MQFSENFNYFSLSHFQGVFTKKKFPSAKILNYITSAKIYDVNYILCCFMIKFLLVMRKKNLWNGMRRKKKKELLSIDNLSVIAYNFLRHVFLDSSIF